MPDTAAELQAKIDAIDERLATTAGIRASTFGDQSVTFDYDALVKERARLAAALKQISSAGTTTRYAATRKGV